MTEQSAARARFTEMRARALTNVLLTGREDLLVLDFDERDVGIDYLVTIRSEKPGLRQFAVELRATHAPVTTETANRVLKPALQGIARYGPFPYPAVLFFFTMMEPQSWYTWVMEPVHRAEGGLTLEMQTEADAQLLDDKALNRIVACVNDWYDAAFGLIPGGKNARPQRAAKNVVKPERSEVVITEIDSVTFDYSDALRQTRELLAAAQKCSNYIVKAYPTPLTTLTGFWDRAEDEKQRSLILFSLRDEITKHAATARFTPKDLQSPSHVYRSFVKMVEEILHPA